MITFPLLFFHHSTNLSLSLSLSLSLFLSCSTYLSPCLCWSLCLSCPDPTDVCAARCTKDDTGSMALLRPPETHKQAKARDPDAIAASY